MDVLVAYDIADTQGAGRRRLDAVASICASFGSRVQLSVFECRVSPENLARMTSMLLDAIDGSVDSILIYRFDGPLTRSRVQLGRGMRREVDEPWIV